MKNWLKCKNIVCIRLDNMGDLLMSAPAIHALKKTVGSKITVLTSSMAEGMAKYIPFIDEVIAYDAPWVKKDALAAAEATQNIVEILKKKQFDGAVIFTVFSQNPLPAALLAYLAHIPLRLAYCRENPYELLTHWVQETEPYTCIRHQVKRDLDLVKSIGATIRDDRISIAVPAGDEWDNVKEKLSKEGFDSEKPWLIVHAGVSEKKRQYPLDQWIDTVRRIVQDLHCQVVLTGNASDRSLTDEIKKGVAKNVFSVAGLLDLGEFISLIAQAPLILSVNTVAVHIAAATHTPVIVLYAATNPQHIPWKVPGKVLFFDVPKEQRSKNEILRYVRDKYFPEEIPPLPPVRIVGEVKEFLREKDHKPLVADVLMPLDQ
jgi:ADP-heptose:LPS heptosyltransferase